jgi:hypothetical protein
MAAWSLRNQSGHGQGRGRGTGGSRGRGWGVGKKPALGPSGNCICPKCGHKEPHTTGERCLDKVCPKCGTKMTHE